MTRHVSFLALGVLAWGALAGCNGEGVPAAAAKADELVPLTDAQKEAVRTRIGAAAAQHVELAATSTAALDSALQALAQAPSDAAVVEAKKAWTQATYGVLEAETFVMEGSTVDFAKLAAPAVDPDRIEMILGDVEIHPHIDAASLAAAGDAEHVVTGLGAIEYLLFTAKGPWAESPRRSQYAAAASELIVAEAERARAEWASQGALATGLAGESFDATAARILEALVAQGKRLETHVATFQSDTDRVHALGAASGDAFDEADALTSSALGLLFGMAAQARPELPAIPGLTQPEVQGDAGSAPAGGVGVAPAIPAEKIAGVLGAPEVVKAFQQLKLDQFLGVVLTVAALNHATHAYRSFLVACEPEIAGTASDVSSTCAGAYSAFVGIQLPQDLGLQPTSTPQTLGPPGRPANAAALVNPQITDEVTQSNVKVLGDAPALAMGSLYQATAQALTNAAHNATSAQQQSYAVSQAATSQGVAMLYGIDTASSPTITSALLGLYP